MIIKNKTLGILACIILLFAGSGLSAYGTMIAYKAYVTGTWSSVEGTITSSKTTVRTSSHTSPGAPGETNATYFAEIQYSFEINGLSQVSDKVSFSRSSYGTESEARAVVDKYPAGSSVKVYYNPSNPTETILEAGLTFAATLPLIIGLALLAIATLLAIGVLRPSQ